MTTNKLIDIQQQYVLRTYCRIYYPISYRKTATRVNIHEIPSNINGLIHQYRDMEDLEISFSQVNTILGFDFSQENEETWSATASLRKEKNYLLLSLFFDGDYAQILLVSRYYREEFTNDKHLAIAELQWRSNGGVPFRNGLITITDLKLAKEIILALKNDSIDGKIAVNAMKNDQTHFDRRFPSIIESFAGNTLQDLRCLAISC